MIESNGRGVEARGFALYVGLSERAARAAGRELVDVMSTLQHTVLATLPTAELHTTIAVTPAGRGGNDLDEVRLALGEPAAAARARQHAAERPGLVLDITRNAVRIDREPVRLTDTEFRLLELLVRRPGHVHSRQQLHAALGASDPQHERAQERTIDVHVSHLRGKLERFADVIRTVPGVGYRFDRHPEVAVVDPPLAPLEWPLDGREGSGQP